MTTIIHLPFPVSVNGMFKNRKGGRAKSDKYKAWIKHAGQELMLQKPLPVRGFYRLYVTLIENDNRRRDPDNFVKAVSDLLVSHRVIEDDCLCTCLTVERYKSEKQGCLVSIHESNGVPFMEIGE